MTEQELTKIQRHLVEAMKRLDANGQGDLAEEVHAIFKKVAARAQVAS